MKPMNLYWANGQANFGDSVAPELVKFLFRRDVVWASKWRANLLSIGSLLGWALLKPGKDGFQGIVDTWRMKLRRLITPKIVIFGTGFLSNPFADDALAPSIRRTPDVIALRGARSFEIIKRLGLAANAKQIALGDPGLFFSDLWPDIKRNSSPNAKRGYIPHESEWAKSSFQHLRLNHPELAYIDVRMPPREVFSAIANCREVFSSSLHGLIAADSLGIPNRWVKLTIDGRSEEDNRFKFDDYYSAFGETREPCNINDIPNIDIGTQIASEKIAERKAELLSALEKHLKNL